MLIYLSFGDSSIDFNDDILFPYKYFLNWASNIIKTGPMLLLYTILYFQKRYLPLCSFKANVYLRCVILFLYKYSYLLQFIPFWEWNILMPKNSQNWIYFPIFLIDYSNFATFTYLLIIMLTHNTLVEDAMYLFWKSVNSVILRVFISLFLSSIIMQNNIPCKHTRIGVDSHYGWMLQNSFNIGHFVINWDALLFVLYEWCHLQCDLVS